MSFDESIDELYYNPCCYGGYRGYRGYGCCRPWYYQRPYKYGWGHHYKCCYPYPYRYGWGYGYGNGWPCFAEEE